MAIAGQGASRNGVADRGHGPAPSSDTPVPGRGFPRTARRSHAAVHCHARPTRLRCALPASPMDAFDVAIAGEPLTTGTLRRPTFGARSGRRADTSLRRHSSIIVPCHGTGRFRGRSDGMRHMIELIRDRGRFVSSCDFFDPADRLNDRHCSLANVERAAPTPLRRRTRDVADIEFSNRTGSTSSASFRIMPAPTPRGRPRRRVPSITPHVAISSFICTGCSSRMARSRSAHESMPERPSGGHAVDRPGRGFRRAARRHGGE